MSKSKVLSFFAFSVLLFISSCKKEEPQPTGPTADTSAPVISVNGGLVQYQSLPTTANTGVFTTPQATANDNVDGNLTSSVVVSGTVNPNFKGVYTLYYSVTDAAGNNNTTTVTVNIVNDMDSLVGNYDVFDTIASASQYLNYQQSITTSNTVNRQIHFNRFADYVNNTGIYATISNSVLTMPTQNTGPIGTNNHIHTFSGTGSNLPNEIIINYTDLDNTASSTVTGVMHLIPQ
jgi:PBP1b-binding outer membrane lipoprotein LpoB